MSKDKLCCICAVCSVAVSETDSCVALSNDDDVYHLCAVSRTALEHDP